LRLSPGARVRSPAELVELVVEKSELSGRVLIPASKSHTIRAVAFAWLAEGTSRIRNPLDSADTRAAVRAARAFGAQVETSTDWVVHGTGGDMRTPDDVIDVANSGNTLYISMASAALVDGWTIITGDHQIRRRPAGPLIEALNDLGATAFSTRGNGMAPLAVRGPLRGDKTDLDASKTSQYLTALLINCPLARGDSEIRVRNLVERPFIEMTLGWLKDRGATWEQEGFEVFRIPGGQRYGGFDRRVPGDFSSATFFLCAAAITGSELLLDGLDMSDVQGDKAVVHMLAEMGAEVEELPEGIRIKGGELKGTQIDLNATPDALPALAVTGCFARGETRLVNVPQARLKETDRITVMREELQKMGARVEELPDGLVIHESKLSGTRVNGHYDHRVVMALAVAGLGATGTTIIDTAESVEVTFPNFVELMTSTGARMRIAQ